jgi:starch phosphorylase
LATIDGEAKGRPVGKAVERPRSDAVLPDMLTGDDDIEQFKETVLAKLTLAVGKDVSSASDRDWFVATTLSLRDRVIHRWLAAEREDLARGRKRIYYLSLEFLIGRLLNDVAGNLQLRDIVHRALGDLGVNFDRVRFAEPDAALGNGGLGRLAACFLESMSSLGIPACGYGIRYDHGLFRQIVRDGWQQEYPEEWLSFGNPWVRATGDHLRHQLWRLGRDRCRAWRPHPFRLASGRDD